MKSLYFLLLLLVCYISKGQTLYPYSDGKAWGVTNEKKEVVIAPAYDSTFNYDHTRLIIVKNKKRGLADATGAFIPCQYDFVRPIDKDYAFGKLDKELSIYNTKTRKLIGKFPGENIESGYRNSIQEIHVFSQDRMSGLVNLKTAKVLVKPQYDYISFFDNDSLIGKARVSSNRKYGLIDGLTGKVILPVEYDDITDDRKDGRNVLIAKKENTTAYYGMNGKVLKDFGKPKPESEEYYLEDSRGTGVVEAPMMDRGSAVGELYIYHQEGDQWKLSIEQRNYGSTKILETHDLSGYSKVEKIEYAPYQRPDVCILAAVKNGKSGLIDINGKTLLPFEYDGITKFNYSIVLITKNDKVGLMNTKTMTVIREPIFKTIRPEDYTMGAMFVEMPDGKKGYMDSKSGVIYIPGVNQ